MKPKKHLCFSSLIPLLSETFSKIPDQRQPGKVSVSLHDGLMSGFACMYFKDPSILQFQERLQEESNQNNLRTLFRVQKIPKETQVRSIIDYVDSQHFRIIFKKLYARLQRAKYLERYQILPKMYYFPINSTQFFCSKQAGCQQCLVKQHRNGVQTYSHQVLHGGICHPDCKAVIPFMPEQIINSDGSQKQDCEMNAAKRFVDHIRKEFPKLGFLIGGDVLFSKQPIIEKILEKKMHYLFAVKPNDHQYMMDCVGAHDHLERIESKDEKGTRHVYEWLNAVPLNGQEDAISVNFLRYFMIKKDIHGKEQITCRNSWVTDIAIDSKNVKTLARSGRCRWKNENEIFNVMKNHGYHRDGDYGHGEQNLAYNFYLLTLLAFSFGPFNTEVQQLHPS